MILAEEVKDITSRHLLSKGQTISSKHVLHSISAGIMLIDAETHRVMEVNSQAEMLIGLPSHKITGRECHSFFTSCEKVK